VRGAPGLRRRGLALAGLLLSAGCAASEQALLQEFFAASRLRDTTVLRRIATVVFEPREQGIVRTFEITGVSAERREGQTAFKDVTISTPLVRPDGRTVDTSLVVTLQRTATSSRWIVSGVRDAAASPQVPPP
jgi:hypothetical protein